MDDFLQDGDVFLLGTGAKVYAEVPQHFLYDNRKGDWSVCRGLITIDGEFMFLAGKYIVTKTTRDGGGTGHGPHDVYPDGHHVLCQNLDNGYEVDFYQSGAFTAMNKDIIPVGKGKLKWILEEEDDDQS